VENLETIWQTFKFREFQLRSMRIVIAVALAALMIVSMAYAQRPPATDNAKVSDNMMEPKVKLMNVTSPAFKDNGRIPVQYTADGDDMSPPLRWEGKPEGVAEYAVICEDPDAPGGVFTHWVIYNIPAGYDHLDEGSCRFPAGQRRDAGKTVWQDRAAGHPRQASRYIFSNELDAKLDSRRITRRTTKAMKAYHIAGKLAACTAGKEISARSNRAASRLPCKAAGQLATLSL
jgi:Raf kinase inhibitor-like YbhB/YbcL family protein